MDFDFDFDLWKKINRFFGRKPFDTSYKGSVLSGKRHAPYTKNTGRGLSKKRRTMAKVSRRINRRFR
jgi:hypothetical protein